MGKIVDGIYYNSNGNPMHKGVVEVDGKFYYAGKKGKIIKECSKVVHSEMANDLVKHGTYYFDKNGVMNLSAYKKPKKVHGKKLKKKTVVVFAAVTLTLCLVFLSVLVLKSRSNNFKETGETALSISVPEFKEEIYLCNPQAELYYKGTYTLKQALELSRDFYSPFVFEYEINNADSAFLLLGEKNNLSDGVQYVLNVREKEVSIDNLKTGTQYYFKVTATNESKGKKEIFGSFKTANTNRFIHLPGLYNTRDIGGYETADHKRIKQGLLIRGTEADGLVESNYYLANPKDAEPFGFVYDFDLRNSDIFNATYVSRFGREVGHKFYNSPQYGGIFAKSETEALRQIFSDLADRRKYPMYLHCTYGADRTGTVVFLLQGLLGVSEEDMLTEYKLTGTLSLKFADAEKIQPIYSGLEGVAGRTLNEKIHNFMVGNVGITEKQISEIRSILLEGK